MARNHDDHDTIRQYLLGKLDEDQQQRLEQRLLTEDDLLEEFEIAEEELIDEYLAQELSDDERKRFEQDFLLAPQRKQKLRFARALRRHVSTVTPQTNVIKPGKFALPKLGRQSFWGSQLAMAAVLLIVAGIGFAVWRGFFYQSDVDKGLIALNAAYSQERPLEARITRFDYAPFVTTRGGDAERVDLLARNRAEAILSNAVIENRSAPAHHALGRVYLAKKQFDDAIKEFDEALNGDPKNPQLLSDLGAAWLEKGKISLDKGKANPKSLDSGKGMEELGRSLENLNKALELDNALLEALFNRALSEQYMTLYEKAEQDWRAYLKRDSNSAWADEARRNLKLLEERKARTTRTKEQLIGEFLKAYEARNDDAAWAAMSVSRGRTGNAVVETLLDDMLSLEATGRKTEGNTKLEMLNYAGTLEAQRVQDRFTSDLAHYYESATTVQRRALARAREMMKSAIGLYNRAEWHQAIELFSNARELFSQTGDEGETLLAEAWIGYCHLRIPDPDSSIRIFQALAALFEKKNYRSLYAQSLLALADALNGRNEFSRVLNQASESLTVSEQIQDQANAIRCRQAETNVQLILGNYRESLNATFHALRLAEALPPDAKLTWPFYHEASIGFYFLGMPTTALEFENEALRLATAHQLPLQASRSYDRLSLIFERLKNYDEAMKNSDLARNEAEKIADERARTNIKAHSAMNFGRLYRETGDPQRAVDAYDQAIELYKKLNIDIYQYQSRKGRLLALMALNDNAAAEVELGAVLYWFEQNREKIAEESYRNKFFDTDQRMYDIAVDFQYSKKKDIAKAFEYAETYRARSLLDLLNNGGQITADASNPTLKLSSPTSPLTLPQIQQRLPKQSQLIEYAVLDDKLLIWVITRDNLKSAQKNITRVELERKIGDFLSGLTHAGANSNGQITGHAKELYSILIEPVQDYLDKNLQLSIVSDDKLNFVPFAALMSPASGRYLVEDYALETAPSATIFISVSAEALQREIDKSERLLVVGNPRFDREQFANLPDLPGAEREAKAIANLYQATPLVGNAAVSSRVKEGLLQSDIVHLATHAVPDEQSPLLSKLLLTGEKAISQNMHHSSNGVLEASEIYGMKLPRTRVVVLSACQTGVEHAYRGEGAIGLARPFIAAGVPLVVASLWPVESEATADLMISFHKHRKQDHVSTVEALRRAQLEILHNQQPGSTTNYDWAAFVAIGGYASF